MFSLLRKTHICENTWNKPIYLNVVCFSIYAFLFFSGTSCWTPPWTAIFETIFFFEKGDFGDVAQIFKSSEFGFISVLNWISKTGQNIGIFDNKYFILFMSTVLQLLLDCSALVPCLKIRFEVKRMFNKIYSCPEPALDWRWSVALPSGTKSDWLRKRVLKMIR